MLIAAVVIGLVTAYYFGLRGGGIAAAVSGGLFVAALVMPGQAFTIYALVGVGLVTVLALGPRYGRPGAKANLLRVGRRALGGLWRKLR